MLRKPAFGAASAIQASAVIRFEIISGTTISTASCAAPRRVGAREDPGDRAADEHRQQRHRAAQETPC